ncbi:hypothetical protein FA13DRAFT_1738334 [Coprinellus micaceus]|uniref:Uncharacterized protein n=1 Tax=Coprinellus micaceus TaxID=71717 RepID=A0A4Y7SUD2_COPMI|nr:hypothetical protein FA13DRAFT_1738334 [Coprinellus micaceus]
MATILGTPTIPTSRAPAIHALQWVSMDLAALLFAISNIVGGTHLTVPYITALVTAAFETALLWANRRKQNRRNSVEAPNTPPLGEEESQTLPALQAILLPIACAKWAIGLRVLLAVAWVWALAFVIMSQALIRVPNGFLIFETIWIGAELGVMGTLIIFCVGEQQHVVRI